MTRSNLFLVLLGLVAIVMGGVVYVALPSEPAANADSEHGRISLSDEVEAVINSKAKLLEQLAQDPVVLAQTRASNERSSALRAQEIQELDAQWQSADDADPLVKGLLSNDTAKVLREFMVSHPEFLELFISDAYGLNVGQTGKTSDLFQADESWWKESFADGGGRLSHGVIEFDDSANAEAISIYFPIHDSSKAIGVGKAVVDLNDIKAQL